MLHFEVSITVILPWQLLANRADAGPDMHKSGADCNELIEKTAAALSSDELQQLFLSTQQNNIEMCLKYGIQK